MQLVLRMNGMVAVLVGAIMLIPAAADPSHARPFLLSSFLCVTLGALVAVAAQRPDYSGFRARHAFPMTTFAWLTAAATASLPLHLSGMSEHDAFFEAMSGLTTTGSTVMTGLDTTAPGLLIWRAMLQWIGGIGIIVTAIAVLPMLRVGGMQLFRSESSDTADKELGSAARFAGATVWIYVALTLACALVYEVGGMDGFDAVLHAMTTVSTGGFSTYDASLGHFDDDFITGAATLFMLSGSIPFVWYLRVWHKGMWRSEQVAIYLASLAVIILGMAAWLTWTGIAAPHDALLRAAFNVVSVVTTTGFATEDYTLWGAGPVTVFLIVTVFGGCTGSTSGGIKAMRLILTAKAMFADLRRTLSPNLVAPIRYEGRTVDNDTLISVVAFCTMFLISFGVVAGLLGLIGLDLLTAVSGAATALANVGPGVGEVIGPAGNFAPLPDAAKWVLAFAMLLGRLEILTALILFTPRFWRG